MPSTLVLKVLNTEAGMGVLKLKRTTDKVVLFFNYSLFIGLNKPIKPTTS